MKMYGYMDMIWLQCKDVEMGSYGVCIWVYSVWKDGCIDGWMVGWSMYMDVQMCMDVWMD